MSLVVAHLLGVSNRGSLAYMLLESPLLVSHRPLQECSQTGTWTECATTLQRPCEGPNGLDLCLGYELRPCRERVNSSLPAASLPGMQGCCCCCCCKGISSPVSYHRPTVGDCRTASTSKWKGCTQPVCHAATLTHTHSRLPLCKHTGYNATLKEQSSLHQRIWGVDGGMTPGLKMTQFLHSGKMDPHHAWLWVRLLSYALS